MKRVIIAIWSICLLSSCSDIFQKSITNSSIIIYTPADSLKSKVYTQQFYWEVVPDATNYRLQIASPSFASGKIQSFVLDTTMVTNKIALTLSAGEYEWRLRAQNGGTETSYFTRKLYILQAPFKERPMIVTSPTSSLTTYSSVVAFSWGSVTGAANYYLEIDTLTDGFKNSTTIQISNSLNQKDQTLQKRGSYNWRMYADSTATIKSAYSAIGTIVFGMDTVLLTNPANNASLAPITAQYHFTWGRPKGAISGETLTYSFALYSTSDLTNPIVPGNSTYNVIYAGESALVSGLTSGTTYYWSVMTTDANKASSIYTSKRKFTAG
jgi:hypothetical protein